MSGHGVWMAVAAIINVVIFLIVVGAVWSLVEWLT